MYIPEIPNNSLTSNIEQIKELALALHEKESLYLTRLLLCQK